MLSIYLDNCQDALPQKFESYVSQYFDEIYEPEWFADDFVKRMIRQIDKSEVIGVGNSINIYNNILGNFPPQNLSSGCKGLILLWKDDIAINGDRLGDNCIEFLLEIAENKDISISLSHTPPFPEKFDAYIINMDKYIKTRKEFYSAMIDVRYRGGSWVNM